ncbi:MAG: DUF6588 family protein [Bdellovibrionota bacterium]
MKKYLKLQILVTLLSLLTFSSVSYGAWSFTSLTQDDVDKLMKEMAANTAFHSVLPPSSLGDVWGFELGLAAGGTSSPFVDELAKRADMSTNVSTIVHGGILGAVSIPYGVTFEAMMLPATESGDVKYSQSSFGIKWTFTNVFMTELPVNMAVRGFSAKSELDWKQTQGTTQFVATNSNEISGYQFLISPKLWVVEPYFGIGMANAKGSLTQNGNVPTPIFADGSTSKSSTSSSMQYILGLDTQLLFFGAGLEFEKSFGTNSLTLKLSAKF